MKSILILLAATLTCATVLPASAGQPVREWNAPAEFDKKYEGGLMVTVLPGERVPQVCGALEGKLANVPACSLRTKDGTVCHIFLPQVGGTTAGFDIDQKGLELLFRHEIGHCNGWAGDHRGVINPFTGKDPGIPEKTKSKK